MRVFDVGGIALSLTGVYFLMAWIFMLFVKSRIGTIGFKHILKPALKVLGACALSALPVLWLSPYIEGSLDMSRLSFRMIGLILEGGLFFIVYALLVWVFRMEETALLAQFMQTKKERKAAPTQTPAVTAGSAETGEKPSGLPH